MLPGRPHFGEVMETTMAEKPIPDAVPGAYVWFVGGNRRHSAPLFPSTTPGKTHYANAPDLAGLYDVQVFLPNWPRILGGQKTVATAKGDIVEFEIRISDEDGA